MEKEKKTVGGAGSSSDSQRKKDFQAKQKQARNTHATVNYVYSTSSSIMNWIWIFRNGPNRWRKSQKRTKWWQPSISTIQTKTDTWARRSLVWWVHIHNRIQPPSNFRNYLSERHCMTRGQDKVGNGTLMKRNWTNRNIKVWQGTSKNTYHWLQSCKAVASIIHILR